MTLLEQRLMPVAKELQHQKEREWIVGLITSQAGSQAYYFIDDFEASPGPPPMLFGYHVEETMQGQVRKKVVALPWEAPWKLIHRDLLDLISQREMMDVQHRLEREFKEVEDEAHKEDRKHKGMTEDEYEQHLRKQYP